MQKSGDGGEIVLLKQVLKKTFSKIKEDITLNSNKLELNSNDINILNKNVELFTKELKNIKSLLNHINSSLKNAQQQTQNMQIQPQQIHQQQFQQPNTGLRTEMIRRLKRNKKVVIKQKILSVISSGQYTLPEIKDVIVDENNYCSKASFYRYFEELKNRQFVEVIDINDIKIVVIKSQTSTRL
tara:strand:- start:17809 stop:18360 length:552 start_codon:yes stop_codon:yes gene_type:complete